MRTKPARVLVLALASIQFTACAGRAIAPPATLDPVRLSTMLDDVRRVEVDSNVGRREALEAILSESGVAYELEPFTIEPRRNYPRTEGANLVITLGEGESDIVVGAHYDAVWLRDGTLSRGAVDNAASSVVLARLAETLKDDPLQHRIRIVLFDMEEIGLVGSAKYIEEHESDTIAAAVNFDVNGYGDTLMFGPAAGGGNADVYQLFKETCVEEQLDCQEFDQYPPSDNLSFQAAGIPNISDRRPASCRSSPDVAVHEQRHRGHLPGSLHTERPGHDPHTQRHIRQRRVRGDGAELPGGPRAGPEAGRARSPVIQGRKQWSQFVVVARARKLRNRSLSLNYVNHIPTCLWPVALKSGNF